MITLQNKIVRDGVIVGYLISEDSFQHSEPTDMLYTTQYLPQLVGAGYKVYDRSGDIELPTGEHVSTLAPIDWSTIDQEAWRVAEIACQSAAMTDAEASKYYSYKSSNVSEFQFKTESSYEINTREEFEDYINSISAIINSVGFVNDSRPINYFVNPKALYTVDELVDDKDGIIKANLNVLSYRHQFSSYTEYTETVQFLIDQGVLTNSNPTPGEFIRAYYAWGPDGITGTCIDYKYKEKVDAPFRTNSETLPLRSNMEDFIAANRSPVPYVMSMDHTIRYLDKETNIQGITSVNEFDRTPLIISDESLLMNLKRRNFNGYKYSPGMGAKLSNVNDRLYFTFISSDGFRYMYKVCHNCITFSLVTDGSIKWSTQNFSIKAELTNDKFTLDQVKNEEQYIIWNMCLSKVGAYRENNTLKPPTMSSYEMLLSIGMSPISAINYMSSHVIKDKTFKNNKKLLSRYTGLQEYCVDLWYKPIPEDVLKAFMLKEEDLEEGIKSFLELADLDYLLERRQIMDEQKPGEEIILPGSPEWDPTYTMGRANALFADKDAISYYNNLRFVSDCVAGFISIDALGEGIVEDASSSNIISAEIEMSIIMSELHGEFDINKAAEILESLETSRLINISDIFKKRTAAYNGYLYDLSQARANKANKDNCYLWCYVTKVFREACNKDISEARPYLLELLVLDNKRDLIFRNVVSQAVKQAISESDLFSDEPISKDSYSCLYEKSYRSLAYGMADDIAAELIFRIIGNTKAEPDGNDLIFTVKYDGEKVLKVRLSMQVVAKILDIRNHPDLHVRYCTVYDMNEEEFNPRNGSFVLNVVNASITPWSVVPRKGYNIRTYNLLPSYYKTPDLIGKFGDEWYKEAEQNKGIVPTPLVNLLPSHELPEVETSMQVVLDEELKMMNEYEDFVDTLLPGQSEQVKHYVKRWSRACSLAKAQGKIVKHMPLKQDLVYNEFSLLITGVSQGTSLEFISGENQALKSTATNVIKYTNESLLIDTSSSIARYSIKKVSLSNISLSLFADVYVKLILEGKRVLVYDNIVAYGSKRFCVPLMSDQDAADLINNHAVKENNKWYIVGIDGIYEIGVKS